MYWVTREGVYRWPHLYMIIIIDGEDQSDHELPHFVTRIKSSDEAYKAKVHLMGVIVHHRYTYLYTCPGHVKQGHNVTIQTLWEVITDVKKKEDRLPKNSYLQLDNTTKENKGNSLDASVNSSSRLVSSIVSTYDICPWATHTRTSIKCLSGLQFVSGSTTHSPVRTWHTSSVTASQSTGLHPSLITGTRSETSVTG
jgi:hypothetical protein